MSQFWLASGRRISHVGPREGPFPPIRAIFGAPRRLISVKLGTPTRPTLDDTGGGEKGQFQSNWSRYVGQFCLIWGRRESHFGPRDG